LVHLDTGQPTGFDGELTGIELASSAVSFETILEEDPMSLRLAAEVKQ
jgi:hypothetical protein